MYIRLSFVSDTYVKIFRYMDKRVNMKDLHRVSTSIHTLLVVGSNIIIITGFSFQWSRKIVWYTYPHAWCYKTEWMAKRNNENYVKVLSRRIEGNLDPVGNFWVEIRESELSFSVLPLPEVEMLNKVLVGNNSFGGMEREGTCGRHATRKLSILIIVHCVFNLQFL